jgi:hypothetical protein
MNRTKTTVMFQVANVADDMGVTHRYYQRDAAIEAGVELRTVKRAFSGLLRPDSGAPGPFLEKLGNGRYRIIGLAGHHASTCGDPECLAELRAVPDYGGESKSDKKRRQEAARARAYRARQRAARG